MEPSLHLIVELFPRQVGDRVVTIFQEAFKMSLNAILSREDLLVVWPALGQRQGTGSKPNIDNQAASRRKLISTVRDGYSINTRDAQI